MKPSPRRIGSSPSSLNADLESSTPPQKSWMTSGRREQMRTERIDFSPTPSVDYSSLLRSGFRFISSFTHSLSSSADLEASAAGLVHGRAQRGRRQSVCLRVRSDPLAAHHTVAQTRRSSSCVRRCCRYNSTGLVGNVENTDIGLHIANNMRLNLDGPSRRLLGFYSPQTDPDFSPISIVISIELNKHLHSWFDPGAGKQPNRRIGLAHYHGDF